jgi:hypothetical protein
MDVGILAWLKMAIAFGHEFARESGSAPTARDYAEQLNRGNLGEPEEHAASCYVEINGFFKGKRPPELSANVFRALQDRWGVSAAKFDASEKWPASLVVLWQSWFRPNMASSAG